MNGFAFLCRHSQTGKNHLYRTCPHHYGDGTACGNTGVMSDHQGLMKKRWWVALAAVLMQLCLGTVYAWSIFKKPMMEANSWGGPRPIAFMIYGAVFALAVAFGGNLVDRLGPRIVTDRRRLFQRRRFLGGLANQLQRIELLVVAYGLVGRARRRVRLRDADRHPHTLVPGQAGPGHRSCRHGLRARRLLHGKRRAFSHHELGIPTTFYIWGGASLVVITASAFILRNPPDQWHLGVPCLEPVSGQVPGDPASEAMHSGRFWILWMMLFVSITAGLGLISQLSPMAQDVMIRASEGPVSDERMTAIILTSGTLVALAGLFNGVGRLAWAWGSDTLGRKTVFSIIYVSFVLGFVALAHVSSVLVFACLTFYILACYGGTMASMPALVADEFGHEHIGKIYGAVFTACGLASMCGPTSSPPSRS